METVSEPVYVDHTFELKDLDEIASIINRLKEQSIDDQLIVLATENSPFVKSLMDVAEWTTSFVESLQ